MRYWECECCGSLLVTLPQDSAESYQCPQCGKVGCKRGGKYEEVSAQKFMHKAKLPSTIVGELKSLLLADDIPLGGLPEQFYKAQRLLRESS